MTARSDLIWAAVVPSTSPLRFGLMGEKETLAICPPVFGGETFSFVRNQATACKAVASATTTTRTTRRILFGVFQPDPAYPVPPRLKRPPRAAGHNFLNSELFRPL